MFRLVRACIAVIAIVIGVAFASVNFQPATVDVLFMTVQAPLVIFIGCAFALGALIGLLASGVRILRLREQLRRSRRASNATVPGTQRPSSPKLR